MLLKAQKAQIIFMLYRHLLYSYTIFLLLRKPWAIHVLLTWLQNAQLQTMRHKSGTQ